CSVAVLLCGYVGLRGYSVWKQRHLMMMAHEFMAKPDARNALLCAQQVLQSNPANEEAVRMMAEISDAAGSPKNALLWRRRAVELNPHWVDAFFGLAQTAMPQRDYATASAALDGFGESDKRTAAYHNLAGALASGTGHLGDAEAHFAEAVRLDPHN